jgi:1-deoxy-D-xylulose-5-phosphate reductoisomerase
MARRVIILGSTGSIGRAGVDVVRHASALHAQGLLDEPLKVVGLAAGSSAQLLQEQARELGVEATALSSGAPGDATFVGADAAWRLVREVEADIVLAAMVGVAGLPAAMEAARLGRDVALANKETLVAGGGLMVEACRVSGAKLLPVDSEHSALWQCLEAVAPGFAPPCASNARTMRSIARLTLTASGGPFRTWSKERIDAATPEEAMKHPTWSMGPKVTIDSAGLVNKALEVIEAHWLFGLPEDRIDVLVHPQSIVHGLIELEDGAVLAHLAGPDMRHPIQHALLWPTRAPGVPSLKRVDWAKLRSLEFEPPDHGRFPGLSLAWRVLREGGTSGAIFNAANEAAVARFLAGGIPFGEIARTVVRTMDRCAPVAADSLEGVLEADRAAREIANQIMDGR